ncbi:acylpyruvate hydrolase protein [Marine Group I thaumarchaeote SCGC AAA799-E16]|uniref:Acylpyruvate hydrolase protein n=5 Tax=Marine Group I TaxID=905826 RepID=A0A087S6C5_9ARCH|nr:acylpyruvate hydrolase protein [Marine Group I thaumarchaeote SCGC AAA799-N04]KER05659.1 acylpyruvate hydrolase protein [Marine Group I thaumarchaeote SCGC AAA799-E16]KFM17166.1 acylpyruvate hydrolase protein [Marine Group I thaumarchaeote SCGC AAA799-D11]KFM19024.1 ureidoglycolate lyase protein [Marine Group I thaumarchaeote SCGC RSA3]KFM21279.1 acylpyruvate hydrolase protein [Marine Group I thaumarchaeote SCGC AAA799-B03]
MKIARLVHENNETYGFVKGDKVATKDEITYLTGVPIPYNVKDFLFDGWFDEIKNKIQDLPYEENLSKFKLLAPIPNPNKIICLAFNYVDHAEEQGLTAPEDPAIVIKPRTALNGNNSHIECPDFVTQLDYEIELALIIGKNCKNINPDEAKNVIFGYMVFNDVSARDIQFKDKQFTRGKSFDSFAPCGPWITTADEIQDAQNLKLTTKINGELRQNSSTNNMFIKIPEIISKISKVMTLEKGDIISTGTPAGVMLNKPNAVFLKDGDKVEMEIEGLGILNNTVKVVKSI